MPPVHRSSLISEETYVSNFSGRGLWPSDVQLGTYSCKRIPVVGLLELVQVSDGHVTTTGCERKQPECFGKELDVRNLVELESNMSNRDKPIV